MVVKAGCSCGRSILLLSSFYAHGRPDCFLLDCCGRIKVFEVFTDNIFKGKKFYQMMDDRLMDGASGTDFLLAGWFGVQSAGTKGK